MPTHVLIVDDDLDVHELLNDILEINFSNVKIDRALNGESLWKKLQDLQAPYNLILLNARLNNTSDTHIADELHAKYPDMFNRLILLDGDSEDISRDKTLRELPHVPKPFSLDDFQEVVKKVCVR